MHDLAEGATSVMKTLVIWQMGLSAAKSANLRPRIQIPLGARASGGACWSACERDPCRWPAARRGTVIEPCSTGRIEPLDNQSPPFEH